MKIHWKIVFLVGLAVALGELSWLVLDRPTAQLPSAMAASGKPPGEFAHPPDAAPQSGPSSVTVSPADMQASSNPEAELATALQIPARADRINALDRILGQWAARAPAAALDWARAQPPSLRQGAMTSVLRGMGTRPETAVRLGLLLISQEPQHADDDALAVIQGLGNARRFATAIRFASMVSSDARNDWLASIFKSWGSADPRAALQVLVCQPPAVHDRLFRSLVDGWAAAQPATLAEHALVLPQGPDRDCALSAAMDQWSMQDPVAMSAWLSRQPPSPEFDSAIAALLTRTDSADRPPQMAMDWVGSITDTNLRFSTARDIALKWTKQDAAAALGCVQSTQWLQPAQRTELIEDIQAASGALRGDAD